MKRVTINYASGKCEVYNQMKNDVVDGLTERLNNEPNIKSFSFTQHNGIMFLYLNNIEKIEIEESP